MQPEIGTSEHVRLFEAAGGEGDMSRTLGLDSKRVLVIDSDAATIKRLTAAAAATGYDVASTSSGAECMIMTASWRPDLVLLDSNTTEIDCKDMIRVIRKHSHAAVIVMAGKSSAEEAIELLDLGANDVVTKAVTTGELLARIRSVLRNRVDSIPVALVYRAGALSIDAAAKTVSLDGQSLRLTAKEFEVLHILATAQGRPVTQRHLIEAVWGAFDRDGIQYLRGYILSLRKKLEKNPAEPGMIVTERGIGYRFLSGDG